MSIQDSVEITLPRSIPRNKEFTLSLRVSSRAAGELTFDIDGGWKITPDAIKVKGGLVNVTLDLPFVISGYGLSRTVKLICKLRSTYDLQKITLAS